MQSFRRAIDIAPDLAAAHRGQGDALTTPLFDTPSFTRHLEEASARIYERCHSDLNPYHLDLGAPHLSY